MIIGQVKDVERQPVPAEGAVGTSIQWLLAHEEGVPHFYMRYITVEPGGVIPLHSHDTIHQMFIVKGQGLVLHEDGEEAIEEGSFVYMPSGKIHGTKNTGPGNLEFVCCVESQPTP